MYTNSNKHVSAFDFPARRDSGAAVLLHNSVHVESLARGEARVLHERAAARAARRARPHVVPRAALPAARPPGGAGLLPRQRQHLAAVLAAASHR